MFIVFECVCLLSICDVVCLVGVLYQIVLCVLNDYLSIWLEIKVKVFDVIVVFDYCFNFVVCVLVISKLNMLGILFVMIGEFGFMLFIVGIEDVVCEEGYFVLMLNLVVMIFEVIGNVVWQFFCEQVDGIVVFVLQVWVFYVLCGMLVDMFFVMLQIVFGFDGVSFFVDQVVGVKVVMEYFIFFGYSDILYLVGLQDWIEVELCMCGYFDGLCEVDLLIFLFICGDWMVDFGYFVGKEFVFCCDFIVVFVVNDLMVIGFMYGFWDFGLWVLYDVSVIGFDDIFVVVYVVLIFSMVYQDFFELGCCVVCILFVQICGEQVLEFGLLQMILCVCELVVVCQWCCFIMVVI